MDPDSSKSQEENANKPEIVEFPHGFKLWKGDNSHYNLDTTWFFGVLSDKTWEPHSFKVLDLFLKNPESCYVDIGAWIGPLLVYAMKKVNRFVALEPDQKALKMLIDNIKLNLDESRHKWAVSDVAISDKIGVDTLGHPSGDGNSVSQLGIGSSVVRTFTLGRFLADPEFHTVAPYIDFIKIDVEGSECKILSQNLLLQTVLFLREARQAKSNIFKSKKAPSIADLHQILLKSQTVSQISQTKIEKPEDDIFDQLKSEILDKNDFFSICEDESKYLNILSKDPKIGFLPTIYLSFHVPFFKDPIKDLQTIIQDLESCGYQFFYDPVYSVVYNSKVLFNRMIRTVMIEKDVILNRFPEIVCIGNQI
jgi:FkbM family methyltransferase